MYRLIQRHGKKIMAVMAAFLMVTMALPSFSRFGGGGGGADAVGKMGSDAITNAEVFHAHQAWELMSRTPFITAQQPDRADRSIAQVFLPATAIAQIREHPIMFLLLQKEAQKMSITVSNDQLNGMIENIPTLKTGDPDRDDDLRAALSQLLLVRQAYERASSAIKITQPMIVQQLAAMGQSLTLNTVELNASQYTSKVPPVSPEQLKAQFDQFAGLLKGAIYADNPFGFGYKFPDRVKIQYISTPRAQVRAFVEANTAPGKPKDPYEWEVEAQKYYRQNQTEFATTQPAQTTAATTAPATTTAAASQPAIKPFTAVRDEIRTKLIDAATDRRMAQIQEKITGTLATDFAAWNSATKGGTTLPSNLPHSSLGVPYDSIDYLQKLAAQIQSTFGILPSTQSIANAWLTAEQLGALPGIGQAGLSGGAGQSLPFPHYIMGFTADFLPTEQRTESGVLQHFEPTRPMRDAAGVVYIARVSAADPTHKPASLTEVEQQVRADVISKAAYDLAKADATKMLEQARATDLKTAAAGKPIVKIGPMVRQPGQPVPGLSLQRPASDEFLIDAFKLVSKSTTQPTAAPTTATATTTAPAIATAGTGKPKALIELESTGRIYVAEIADLQALWTNQSRGMEEAQLTMMLKGELDQRFSRDWFDFDSVSTRLAFVPEKGTTPKQTPQRPAEPPPPLF